MSRRRRPLIIFHRPNLGAARLVKTGVFCSLLILWDILALEVFADSSSNPNKLTSLSVDDMDGLLKCRCLKRCVSSSPLDEVRGD